MTKESASAVVVVVVVVVVEADEEVSVMLLLIARMDRNTRVVVVCGDDWFCEKGGWCKVQTHGTPTKRVMEVTSPYATTNATNSIDDE